MMPMTMKDAQRAPRDDGETKGLSTGRLRPGRFCRRHSPVLHSAVLAALALAPGCFGSSQVEGTRGAEAVERPGRAPSSTSGAAAAVAVDGQPPKASGMDGMDGRNAADDPVEILNPPLPQRGQALLTTRDGRRIEVKVEIASNHRDRMKGLMFRRHLGEMEGMAFVFPEEEQLGFWMENTLIPLDMVFVRADGTVLGIVENAVPMDRTTRFVRGASKYVLEVNGGFAFRHGLKAGDRMELKGIYAVE